MWKAWLVSLTILASVGAVAVGLGPFLVSTTPLPGLEPARAAATPASRFLVIPFEGTEGVEVHYVAGATRPGPDVPNFLLLHGFTLNAFSWDELFGFFDGQGHVIAYDQPPYGLSAKLIRQDWTGASPYTRAAAVDQLFATMDALGLTQAILVGNSAGGSLALEAALARPERVTALILVSPWVYAQRPTLPPSISELPQTERLSLFLARRLGQSAALLRRSYADPSRLSDDRLALAGVHARVANWDLAWGHLLHQSLTDVVSVSTRLPEVMQPVLVITGDQDRLVPLADTEQAATALPLSELVVLPGCGHVAHEECPGQVADAVADWLAGLQTTFGSAHVGHFEEAD